MCDESDFYVTSAYYDSGQTRKHQLEHQPERELADAYAGYRWLALSAIRRLWGWHKARPERQSPAAS